MSKYENRFWIRIEYLYDDLSKIVNKSIRFSEIFQNIFFFIFKFCCFEKTMYEMEIKPEDSETSSEYEFQVSFA